MQVLKPVEPRESSQSRRHVERATSRFGARLASPLGILLIMPGLVSLVGAFLSLLGEYSLRNSNLEVAQERMTEQARLAGRSVRDALEQSEAVLDRLQDLTTAHDPSRPIAPFAHAMLDLMSRRSGVTYVSASFPDGTFQGAYLDPESRSPAVHWWPRRRTRRTARESSGRGAHRHGWTGTRSSASPPPSGQSPGRSAVPRHRRS